MLRTQAAEFAKQLRAILFNVPAGVYQLEIRWSRDPNQAPIRYTISVNAGPYSNIAPIQVP
ncbi:MAG: hypothetical protein ACRD11_10280 [Terriglobia bacterium]